MLRRVSHSNRDAALFLTFVKPQSCVAAPRPGGVTMGRAQYLEDGQRSVFPTLSFAGCQAVIEDRTLSESRGHLDWSVRTQRGGTLDYCRANNIQVQL
jgi:hypothetical protein